MRALRTVRKNQTDAAAQKEAPAAAGSEAAAAEPTPKKEEETTTSAAAAETGETGEADGEITLKKQTSKELQMVRQRKVCCFYKY